MVYLYFLLALLTTVAVEGLLMFLLFRRWDFVYYTLICNLLTNPAMNLLLLAGVRFFGPGVYWPALLALEFVVVALEGLILRLLCRFRLIKALAFSLLLNAASFGIGLLFYLV